MKTEQKNAAQLKAVSREQALRDVTGNAIIETPFFRVLATTPGY